MKRKRVDERVFKPGQRVKHCNFTSPYEYGTVVRVQEDGLVRVIHHDAKGDISRGWFQSCLTVVEMPKKRSRKP